MAASSPHHLNGESSRTGVLLLARHLDLGGTERQLCEMAQALDPARFDVHVGCFRTGGIRATEISKSGLPLVHLPLESFKSPVGVQGAVRALRRYVRAHGIDVVHAFDPPAVFFAGLAAPFVRPATVLSSQRCFRDACTPNWQRLLHWAERWTDGVVVNCRALQQHRGRLGSGAPAMHLCYNGLDVGRFRRLASPPRPAAIPADAMVVGSVCGLRPEKGLPTLLLAFAAARAVEPNLFLVLVGDGSERSRLEEQARQLGIGPRCFFQPKAADVVPWLSLIDIFVLPSSANEALSNALMEAMACGCACVASNVGGNPELVDDERTGLLFEAGDVGGLSRQLRRLAGDARLRQQLASSAQARVATEFSLTASAKRMGAIYEEVLGRAPVVGAAASRVNSLSHNGQATV